MAEIETLGMLDEIQSIVIDRLQVVSYKWLSRNFLVSSNAAKRLLEEFVAKYDNGFEVVFAMSGWLKNNPTTYNIRLVSKHKLAESKQEFDGHCSVQVYSIQACLPKDPVTLWNDEFVQAEDLYKQPLTVDNCLRDNRFCGISNSFVKRNAGETHLASGLLQKKTTASGLSKIQSPHCSAAISQHQSKKVPQTNPNVEVQSSDILKNERSKTPVNLKREQGAPLANNEEKAPSEKAPQVLPNKVKDQSDKTSSGTGGSLASMWSRASTKSKPDAPAPLTTKSNKSLENSVGSAEVRICDSEVSEYGNSDEDGNEFNIIRTSSGEGRRKRKVVFDFSDEEDEYEDAVSLASPDPPKKSQPESKHSSNSSGQLSNLSSAKKESKPKMNYVKEADGNSNPQLEDNFSVMGKDKKAESPVLEKPLYHIPETDAIKKDNMADTGPKRRKVLKSRIDERGREVTEVIWEGDEPDSKTSGSLVEREENKAPNKSTDRQLVARKSPGVGSNAPANPPGKTGNKKAANKDPKQGNILSFFKKT